MSTSLQQLIMVIMLFAMTIWFQMGGVGMEFIIKADDITLREATCEVMSVVTLSATLVILAHWRKP